jgi:hypothetical protein
VPEEKGRLATVDHDFLTSFSPGPVRGGRVPAIPPTLVEGGPLRRVLENEHLAGRARVAPEHPDQAPNPVLPTPGPMRKDSP